MITTFLLQFGAGCLLGALPVPAPATGKAFNRFVAGLAGFVLMLGLASFYSGAERPSSAGPLWILTALLAIWASAASHTGRLKPGRRLLQAAAFLSLPALILDAIALAGSRNSDILSTARYILDALSSSWLLGSVLIAMILGHYYLNIPGLPIQHLIRLCLIAVAAVSLRSAAFILGFAVDGHTLITPIFEQSLADGVDMLTMVVLIQRLLFGLAGGTALCLMAWRTARINSTQSATGILYIGFIAVVVGELASRYLLFGTGHAL
jgi:hypothetical protein